MENRCDVAVEFIEIVGSVYDADGQLIDVGYDLRKAGPIGAWATIPIRSELCKRGSRSRGLLQAQRRDRRERRIEFDLLLFNLDASQVACFRLIVEAEVKE